MIRNTPPSRSTCEHPQAAHIGINYKGSNKKKYLLVAVLAMYTSEEIQTLNVHGRKGGTEYSQQE
jgi:hypothetical protein